MNADEVKEGDIIHSDDDSIIKVHHIDDEGYVHYMAYADCARGCIQVAPYPRTYGTIDECYPASEGDKQWLEEWIKENTPHPAVNWINARVQRPEHMQRCLCWSTTEYEPKHRIYVYDDISKYWCTQGTTEHDPNGDNHISDYACYHISHWMPVTDIPKPEDL